MGEVTGEPGDGLVGWTRPSCDMNRQTLRVQSPSHRSTYTYIQRAELRDHTSTQKPTPKNGHLAGLEPTVGSAVSVRGRPVHAVYRRTDKDTSNPPDERSPRHLCTAYGWTRSHRDTKRTHKKGSAEGREDPGPKTTGDMGPQARIHVKTGIYAAHKTDT